MTSARTGASKTRKSIAKKPAKKKPVAAKAGTRKATSGSARAASPKPAPRADLGAPIDGFFSKQPNKLRPILEELRKIVEATVPEAQSSLKWGMPFYTLAGEMMCALGGHKSHVNLMLAGPAEAFADPDQRLEGDGKTGRRLKLTQLDQLPRAAVKTWVKAAAGVARARARANPK